MSLQRAAHAALAGRNRSLFILIAATFLSAFFVSCGGSSKSKATHNAYVTFPQTGSVALLHINDSSGNVSVISQTSPVLGTSPVGLALHSSKKFLYVANSDANTVSIFNVAGDGTLTQTGNTAATGSGPRAAVIDPSGKFLLVTNSLTNDINVFSIDSSGALTEIAVSPFPAGASPTDLQITPSGFVYVANPNSGFVLGFKLELDGMLTSLGAPFSARVGVAAIAIDAGGHFLYTANATDASVSAFTIDPAGALHSITGSPFPAGTAPRGIAIDPATKFLYVANQGSNNISGFTIASDGRLTAMANLVTGVTAPVFLIAESAGTYIYAGNQTGNGISSFSYDATTGVLTAVSGSPFLIGSAPGAMVISH
jgi:6-phosphogluconolactonase